jgi:hypothetical protein
MANQTEDTIAGGKNEHGQIKTTTPNNPKHPITAHRTSTHPAKADREEVDEYFEDRDGGHGLVDDGLVDQPVSGPGGRPNPDQ